MSTEFKFEILKRGPKDNYSKDLQKFRIYPFEPFTLFRLKAREQTEHYKKGEIVATGVSNKDGDAFLPFYKDKGLSVEVQILGISEKGKKNND